MKHTIETKMKISEARKKYLKENPDKHPWRGNNCKMSLPCQKVKDFLILKNIAFVDEYIPLLNKNYSIDIAFPDKKIGIEINGNQHYDSDGKLKEYYLNRHNLIESNGWKLLELHYSSAYKNEELEKIFLNFNWQPDYSKYFEHKKNQKNKQLENVKNKLERKIKKENEITTIIAFINDNSLNESKASIKSISKSLEIKYCKVLHIVKCYFPEMIIKRTNRPKTVRLHRGEKIKLKTNIRWEPFKYQILESNINFKKFGWVNKVSIILKISPQKVNKWMKKYLPDFYETSCFKRKNGTR